MQDPTQCSQSTTSRMDLLRSQPWDVVRKHTLPPAPTAFSWDDVILQNMSTSRRKIICGTAKCYFPSWRQCLISDSSGRCTQHVGYLIEVHSKYLEYSFTGFVRDNNPVWSYASCVAERYGANHFLLGPEEHIEVPEEAAHWLTHTQFQKWDANGSDTFHQNILHDFNETTEHKVLVYRVQEASGYASSPFLLKCRESKLIFAREHLVDFLASVEDYASFMGNLTEQLSATHDMLSSEQCLLGDFQVIINNQGLVFHIDLDRCFKSRGDHYYSPYNKYLIQVHTRLGDCFEEFQLHTMATIGLVTAN